MPKPIIVIDSRVSVILAQGANRLFSFYKENIQLFSFLRAVKRDTGKTFSCRILIRSSEADLYGEDREGFVKYQPAGSSKFFLFQQARTILFPVDVGAKHVLSISKLLKSPGDEKNVCFISSDPGMLRDFSSIGCVTIAVHEDGTFPGGAVETAAGFMQPEAARVGGSCSL